MIAKAAAKSWDEVLLYWPRPSTLYVMGCAMHLLINVLGADASAKLQLRIEKKKEESIFGCSGLCLRDWWLTETMESGLGLKLPRLPSGQDDSKAIGSYGFNMFIRRRKHVRVIYKQKQHWNPQVTIRQSFPWGWAEIKQNSPGSIIVFSLRLAFFLYISYFCIKAFSALRGKCAVKFSSSPSRSHPNSLNRISYWADSHSLFRSLYPNEHSQLA